MSYYIKGNAQRGAEVIALLESKGGNNIHCLTGKSIGSYYFIDKNRIIVCMPVNDIELLRYFCEELTLPEKEWKPKFKVGDYMMFQDSIPVQIVGINSNEETYQVAATYKGKESKAIEAQLKYWEPKRGETVLVTESYNQYWEEAIFSFKTDTGSYHTVGGQYWNFCIPFDINKLGKRKY